MSTPINAELTLDPGPKVEPRSRRAVLAAAAGGAAALVAAIARPARSKAAAGSALIIGIESNNAGTANTQLLTNSSVVAFKLLQNGPGTALMGYATPASGATRGVYGRSDSPDGDGVQARNAGAHGSGAAIHAYGGNNSAIIAESEGLNNVAISATNTSDGTASAGVRANSTNGIALYGTSVNGIGLFADSTSTWAGWFDNQVFFNSYLQIKEIASPSAPGSTGVRLFVRDNGAGKTQLCARFATGAIQVISTQP